MYNNEGKMLSEHLMGFQYDSHTNTYSKIGITSSGTMRNKLKAKVYQTSSRKGVKAVFSTSRAVFVDYTNITISVNSVVGKREKYTISMALKRCKK